MQTLFNDLEFSLLNSVSYLFIDLCYKRDKNSLVLEKLRKQIFRSKTLKEKRKKEKLYVHLQGQIQVIDEVLGKWMKILNEIDKLDFFLNKLKESQGKFFILDFEEFNGTRKNKEID